MYFLTLTYNPFVKKWYLFVDCIVVDSEWVLYTCWCCTRLSKNSSRNDILIPVVKL